VHGDEGRAKDQQQDCDKLHVGRVPGESQNKKRIFESSQQLKIIFKDFVRLL